MKKKPKIKSWYTAVNMLTFRDSFLIVITPDKATLLEEIRAIHKDLGIVRELEEYVRNLTKLIEEGAEYAEATTYMIDTPSFRSYLICFFRDNPSQVKYSTVVHEAHHAASFLCDSRGIDDEETETYIQEYTFTCLFDYIERWCKKHKKEPVKLGTYEIDYFGKL